MRDGHYGLARALLHLEEAQHKVARLVVERRGGLVEQPKGLVEQGDGGQYEALALTSRNLGHALAEDVLFKPKEGKIVAQGFVGGAPGLQLAQAEGLGDNVLHKLAGEGKVLRKIGHGASDGIARLFVQGLATDADCALKGDEADEGLEKG